VIEFLVKEEIRAGNIPTQFQCPYADACMGVSSIRQWIKHSEDGNTDNANELQSGCPQTTPAEHKTGKIDGLIRQNQCMTVREIAAETGRGHHDVHDVEEIWEGK
jgi:hypothetical protein